MTTPDAAAERVKALEAVLNRMARREPYQHCHGCNVTHQEANAALSPLPTSGDKVPPCTTCGGAAHASGKPCVCGGANTIYAEVDGLRALLFSPTSGDGGRGAALEWQPMTTAPKDREVFWWLRSKTADETYRDTSGKPILAKGEPRTVYGLYGRWSSLQIADGWYDPTIPLPPGDPTDG